MTQKDLRDVKFLKLLAKESQALAHESVTPNRLWRAGYEQLARGAGLLWRLLDQSSINEGGLPERVYK